MKKLLVLRHAKSSWDDPNMSDFERPLNPRGLNAAPFMGKLIAEKGLSPCLIVSSPAERAKRTAELIRENSGVESELAFDERIYEASPQMLLQVVSQIGGTNPSVMLVGHNPGIEGFIRYLTGELQPMPTASLAVIDLNIAEWDQIGPNCGRLTNLYRPKDEIKASGKGG